MRLDDPTIDIPVTEESGGYNLMEINTSQVQVHTSLVSVIYGAQIINQEDINCKLCLDKSTKQLVLKPPTLKSASSGQCDYYIILVALSHNGLRFYGDALVPFRVSAESTRRRAEDYKLTIEKHSSDLASLVKSYKRHHC